MRVFCIICLLALVAVGPQLHAEAPSDALAGVVAENKSLKKLITGLNEVCEQLNAEIKAQKLVIEKLKASHRKTVTEQQARAMEYKLALAENKMLKARINSLLRTGGSSTTKPAATRNRKNVRFIEIELRENLWKWWIDPLLLSDHLAMRRKLVHLDTDHSIDSWLTRRGEFAGTRVNWPMKLVSGNIISKKEVDNAWKAARQNLKDTLSSMVYDTRRPAETDNDKIVDRRMGAGSTSRPASGKQKGTAKPKVSGRDDLRKRIRNLQDQIAIYKRASQAGGMTTIYAVAGDIAVKMSLPGRHFENVVLTKRPSVQITGDILRAAPKAGFFAGRKGSMIQFVVSGECKIKNPHTLKRKPK
jgi:hypothetical protein